MISIVIIVSVIIKLLSLLIVSYAFFALSPKKEKEAFGPLTKYFIMKRKYNLLRYSLVFVAGLLVLELISPVFLAGDARASDLRTLTSDVIFLGLIILLSQIYRNRERFSVID